MKGTIKKIVSILLALALVITSIQYTPKTVIAAEDYSGVQFTEVTEAMDSEYAYSIMENTLTGYTGVEFYDTNYMKIMGSGDSKMSTATITVNGEVATIAFAFDRAEAITGFNISTLEDDAYYEISLSGDGGNLTFILRKGNPQSFVEGAELLQDRTFSNGLNAGTDGSSAVWLGESFDTTATAAGIYAVNNGILTITGIPAYTSADEAYDTQLKQTGISISSGKWYKATATVTSDVEKYFQVMVQSDGSTDNTWEEYSKKTELVAAGETKIIEVVFQATKTDSNALFGIFMGDIDNYGSAASNVTISNVSMTVYSEEPNIEYADAFENIEAEAWDLESGAVKDTNTNLSGGGNLGGVTNGAVAGYYVNFTEAAGAVEFYAVVPSDAGGTVSVYVDSLDSTPEATIDLTETVDAAGNWDYTNYATVKASIDISAGKHIIYTKYETNGSSYYVANVDYFKFIKKSTYVDAFSNVEAEGYVWASKADSNNAKKESNEALSGGGNLGGINDGLIVSYDVSFSEDASGMDFFYVTPKGRGGSVEIYVDSMIGDPIATMDFVQTEDSSTTYGAGYYKTMATKVDIPAGNHTIYTKYSAKYTGYVVANIDYIKFRKESEYTDAFSHVEGENATLLKNGYNNGGSLGGIIDNTYIWYYLNFNGEATGIVLSRSFGEAGVYGGTLKVYLDSLNSTPIANIDLSHETTPAGHEETPIIELDTPIEKGKYVVYLVFNTADGTSYVCDMDYFKFVGTGQYVNDNLTAECGEGAYYSTSNDTLEFTNGVVSFIEKGIFFSVGSQGKSVVVTLNDTEVAKNDTNSALGYELPYTSLAAGTNTIVVTEVLSDGTTEEYTVTVYVPTTVRNINVNNYSSTTGKYIFKFDEVDGATEYKVYINGSATSITLGGSGDYIDYSELSAYGTGDLSVTLTAVLDDSSETVASKEVVINKPTNAGAYTQIPQIYVQTDDLSVGALSITKDAGSFESSITVIDAAGGTYEDIYDDTSKTTIKVRGNSTAVADKKAFNIKFKSAKNLLGLSGEGKKGAKKWSLLANAFDKSLIRNKLAMDLGIEAGIPFNSTSAYVDLYLNGRYMGNYLLIESVETGDSRVEVDAENTTNSDILLELDSNGRDLPSDAHLWNPSATHPASGETTDTTAGNAWSDVTTKFGLRFAVNSPEGDPSEPEEYIQYTTDYADKMATVYSFLNNFETALEGNNYDTIATYIDVDSFVTYYIINEFFKNQDINFSSTRFHILNGKLYAGPMWDLDLSSGNVSTAYYTDAQRLPTGFKATDFKWYELLMSNATFKEQVKAKYAELLPSIRKMYADNGTIDQILDSIAVSIERNYATYDSTNYGAGWSVTVKDSGDGYSYANNNATTSFNDEGDENSAIAYLKDWIEKRADYLATSWDCMEVTLDKTDEGVIVSWVEQEGATGYRITYTPAIAEVAQISDENSPIALAAASPAPEGTAYVDVASDVTSYNFTANGIELESNTDVTVTYTTDGTNYSDVGTVTYVADGDYSQVKWVTFPKGSAARNQSVYDEWYYIPDTYTSADFGGNEGCLGIYNYSEDIASIPTWNYDELAAAGVSALGWVAGTTVTSVTIDGTEYLVGTGNNNVNTVYLGHDCLYINQDLFKLADGVTSKIYEIVVTHSDATTLEFPLMVTSEEIEEEFTWEEVTNSNGQYLYNSNHSVKNVVSVQKPYWSAEQGIYIETASGISSISVNGVTTEVASVSGAGAVIHLSALTSEVNNVVITHADGNTSTIKFKNTDVNAKYTAKGVAATVAYGDNNIATINWTASDAAIEAGYTYKVFVGENEAILVSGSTSANYDFTAAGAAYGVYAITVQTLDADGNVLTSATGSVNYKDPDSLESDVVFKTNMWEKKRNEPITWTAVPRATGYAIYADGVLYESYSADTLSTAVDAYAFATYYSEAFLGQKSTVGEHTTAVVALLDNEEAPATLAEVDTKQILGQNEFTLHVNYVYGNLTNLWNSTTIDSLWNFTICESDAEGSNITRGAEIQVTYSKDEEGNEVAASLKFVDRGQHATYVPATDTTPEVVGDQAWTVKAAIYDAPIQGVVGDDQKLTFSIMGPSVLVGQRIQIKCVPEEVDENGNYIAVGDSYEEAIYTFVDDGNGEAILNYSLDFVAEKEDYDLLFGLGLLEFGDSEDTTIEFTEAKVTENNIYGVTAVNPSGILNTDDNTNNSIYVAWTTDVPSNLASYYTYKVYIDGQLVDDNAINGTTYPLENQTGFALGEHVVTVESYYHYNDESSMMTSSKSAETEIIETRTADLVISNITLNTSSEEPRFGETFGFTATMTNIGTLDATPSTGYLTAWAFLDYIDENGVSQSMDLGYVHPLGELDADGNQISQTLADGASTTFTYSNITIPASLDNEYEIRVVADYENQVSEGNENNNTTLEAAIFYEPIKTITFTTTENTDGTMEVVGTWPEHEYAGSYTVIYTSGGVEVTQTVTENTVVFENEIDAGTTVYVKANDVDGDIHGYAEGEPLPDLIISEVSIPSTTYQVGDVIPVTITMKNVGATEAKPGDGNLTLKITRDGIDGDYRTLAQEGYAEQKLEVGEEFTYTFNYTVKEEDLVAGTIKLGGHADADDKVYEGEATAVGETNNWGTPVEITVTAATTLEVVTLTNDGTDIKATWPDAGEGTEYVIEYVVDGVTKTAEIDTNNYTFPAEDVMANGTTVKVYTVGSDNTNTLYAEGTAKADLIIETIVPENGLVYVGQSNNLIVTVKNIGTAKADASEGQESSISAVCTSTGVFTNYAIVEAGLEPNATTDITVVGYTPTTAGVTSLTAITDDVNRIAESNEDNNTFAVDITAVNEGAVELSLDDSNPDTPFVKVSWENPEGVEADVDSRYMIKYVVDGVEITDYVQNSDGNEVVFAETDADGNTTYYVKNYAKLDNQSAVYVYVVTSGTEGEEYIACGADVAEVDLVITTIVVDSEASRVEGNSANSVYLDETFSLIVSVKNQGTAKVAESSDTVLEDGTIVDYGKWLITQMKSHANVSIDGGDGLVSSHTGLFAGVTKEYTFSNVVVNAEGTHTVEFKTDSPGFADVEAAGFIPESDENNNTNTVTLEVTDPPFRQEKMDWEPLVYENGENVGQVYPFDIAGGSQNGHIYYKVYDTNITDEHYYDIFPKTVGYNNAYISFGMVDSHQLFNYGTNAENEHASMDTKIYFALLPDANPETIDAAINGTLDERYNMQQITTQNTDYVGEDGTLELDPAQPMNTNGQGFNYYTGDWGLYKYYMMRFENETTGEYYTVVYKVTDENDEMNNWVKSYSKDGTDPDKLPVYYHDETCQTTGSVWYDATLDLRFSSITCYNGNYLAVHLSDSVVFGDTYKIEMAYASIDSNGEFVIPTTGFTEIPIYNKEGLQTLQLQLPTIFRELAVHSELGGQKDNEYYYMKIYYNTDSEETSSDYIEVPIRVLADIPMVEEIQGLTASGRGDSLTVMWTNTATQDIHGYLYDVYIDKNFDGDYDDEGEKVSSDVVAGAYSYAEDINLADNPSYNIKVVGKWCYATSDTDPDHPAAYQQTVKELTYTLGGEQEKEEIPGETPTYPEDSEKWVLINGENVLPITSGDGTMKAQIWYYTDDDMYSVVGYNGHYISLNGNTTYFTGEDSKLYVQDGENDTTFESKAIHDNFYDGQILINAANMFSTYGEDVQVGDTLYYTVKVAGEGGNTEKDFYFKVVLMPDDAGTGVTDNGKWRLISGQNTLPVMFKDNALVGTIEYYDYASLTNTYDMTGYNDYFISVIGNGDNYSGNTAKLYISEPSETEILGTAGDSTTFTAVAGSQTYSEKEIYDKVFRGQIQMRSSTTFEVAYRTTYYLLKIEGTAQDTDAATVTYVPVRVTVSTGDVEVQGFQMNTDKSEGGIAQNNPSFRVVSRASNVMTIGNVLYEVKNYGTVYALDSDLTEGGSTSKYEAMKIDSSNENVKYFQATKDIGTLNEWTSANGDEKYNKYYALSFEYKYYSYESLTRKMAFRAYAIIDDGTAEGKVVYGNNVYSTSMEKIAENLYTYKKMGTLTAHQYLYDNVLNIVAIGKNRLKIAQALMKATDVTSAESENYAIVNQTYKDMWDYIYCRNSYTYADRAAFKCSTQENEDALLAIIDPDNKYGSVANWITANVDSASGFHAVVKYEYDNSIDKEFDSE